MSRERLLDLKEALNQKGWKIILDSENENDIFKIYNEGLIWRIMRSSKYGIISLEFDLTNHFGIDTGNINDIFSCSADGVKDVLYFSKINSPEWEKGLKKFMSALDEVY